MAVASAKLIVGDQRDSLRPHCAWMEHGFIAVGESGNRRRRGQDGDVRAPRALLRLDPANEAEPPRVVAQHEAVPGSQGRGVVEEEHRCPPARHGKRMAPTAVLGEADDPQRAAMVTGERGRFVDQAAAVAGDQPSFVDGMQIAPRVYSVAARRTASLSFGRRAITRQFRELGRHCSPGIADFGLTDGIGGAIRGWSLPRARAKWGVCHGGWS